MIKITFACIYRSTCDTFDPDLINTSWQPLTIAGNDVRFLIDVLRYHSTFHDISENIWRLDFFEHSKFRQVLYVSIIEKTLSKAEIDNDQVRKLLLNEMKEAAYQQIKKYIPKPREVVKATLIQTNEYKPSEVEILTASQLIRNTKSMLFDSLERHSDRFIHVDGRGTCIFSPNDWHKTTFKRQVILLALAKAYLLGMNEIMNDLAMHCEHDQALRELYKSALVFNAKYFFANPVKINRYDAFQLWEGIRQCTKIDDINNEITQQLQAVHHILSQEEENKQLKSELKLNKHVGWLGVAIGLLSLISLFEITPTKVTEFIQAWITYING